MQMQRNRFSKKSLLVPLLLKCQIWISPHHVCEKRNEQWDLFFFWEGSHLWSASSNWDKFSLTLAAFFSFQMMRHKSLVLLSGLSPLVQTTKHYMFLLHISFHICCFGKCLITLVALWDVETQIVGCQLARAARWTTKHNWLLRSPAHHSQSHSRLQQIQQIQNHRGRNTSLPKK